MQKKQKRYLFFLFLILILSYLVNGKQKIDNYIQRKYFNDLALEDPEKYQRKTLQIITKKSIPKIHQVSKNEIKVQQSKNNKTKFDLIICNMLDNKTDHLFKSKFKIWKLETSDDEAIVMVKPENCPKDLFSYLVLDSTGKIKEYIDCHNTTHEELVLNAGIQGEILESSLIKNRLDLAISGPGYFLEKCHEKFYLIRQGAFLIASNKTLMTNNGCSVVDQNGDDFKILNQKINSRGCTSKQCLAIIQPREEEFKYMSRNRLSFHGTIEASRIESPTIYINSLENFNQDAGIIGPNFDLIPNFNKSSCE